MASLATTQEQASNQRRLYLALSCVLYKTSAVPQMIVYEGLSMPTVNMTAKSDLVEQK